MKKISEDKLERINGGFSTWMAIGIASGILFISGIIKGIVSPSACQ